MALFYELTWTQEQGSPVLGTTRWRLGPQISQMNDFCHPLRRLVIWHQQVLLEVGRYIAYKIMPYFQCPKVYVTKDDQNIVYSSKEPHMQWLISLKSED